MRFVPDELAAEEVEAFLREQVVARIGCHAGGETYVVPVIYAYDDGAAYVMSIEGRKIRMMRENPRVCFEVDRYDQATGGWRSVIALGRYEELSGAGADAALALLARTFAERAGRRSSRPATAGTAAVVAFRIRLEEPTGREVVRPA
jgi:nitroimidazol reductase NimA-like FMN-containing flavoprotein (pyridoxamine 5'-phosphate oxidase superfamily)